MREVHWTLAMGAAVRGLVQSACVAAVSLGLSLAAGVLGLLHPAGDPWDTFRRTLSGRFYVPHFISDAAADLIFKLLQVRGCLWMCACGRTGNRVWSNRPGVTMGLV